MKEQKRSNAHVIVNKICINKKYLTINSSRFLIKNVLNLNIEKLKNKFLSEINYILYWLSLSFVRMRSLLLLLFEYFINF